MWWQVLIIASIVFIAVILVDKFVNGLSGIWKMICFPFWIIYKLFQFIFKK